MNREDCRSVTKGVGSPELPRKENGGEARLPIVRMHDIVRLAQMMRPIRAQPESGARIERDCPDSRRCQSHTAAHDRISRVVDEHESHATIVGGDTSASTSRPSSGTVTRPAGAPAAMPRYRGMTTSTRCPRFASARGSAPTTSARPPVLANGTHLGRDHQNPHSQLNLSSAFDMIGLWPTERLDRRDPAASESREAAELRALKQRQPELADAVDMHLELLEVQRRIQARIPIPSLDISEASFRSNQAEDDRCFGSKTSRSNSPSCGWPSGRRPTSSAGSALDDSDFQKVQALGRDESLFSVLRIWYRAGLSVTRPPGVTRGRRDDQRRRQSGANDEVFALAMRPFLSRCAEVIQQRAGARPVDASALRAVRRRARSRGDHADGRTPPDLRPLRTALEVRVADLPVLPQRRPIADHLVCDARRALPRLCVRCVRDT